ncbi:MAG: CDP-archaeol synthase [Candidatus Nanoarchaeia archaeon]|jgi:CDP-2,3-bis-(O-geranylgeranyl)-sn-glycerol synthase
MFELIFYTIIAYFTNASCTLAANHKTHPIDFKVNLGRERLLGDGKTFEGLFAGFNAGILLSILLMPWIDPFIGVLVSIGALIGDLVGSFIKRRLRVKSGAQLMPLDQLGFIIFAYLVLSFFVEVDYLLASALIIITFFAHLLSNRLAKRFGLKRVPW